MAMRPPMTPDSNPSMPVATSQHNALSDLSRLVPCEASETFSFTPAKGERLCISLMMLRVGQLKVAGLSEGGLAKQSMSEGDTIVEINGRRPLSERSAYQILRDSNEVTMKVVKRDRSDSFSSGSENSTERTASPPGSGARDDPMSPRLTSHRKFGRISSFSRRSKVAAV